MGEVSYKKVCHLERCHKPFESKSRNQKYCSDECLAASRQVHRSRGKRRRAYQKDAPNRRAQSMSRAQAREFAINELVLTICQGCGKPTKVADIETHHRDGDPFHNNLQNFALLCKKCHAQADVEWRKAKAANQPIPECRVWMLAAEGNGITASWGVASFRLSTVPYMDPPTPEPTLVNMVHDSVIIEPTKVVPGTLDPYLEGIMKGGEEDCIDNWHEGEGAVTLEGSCPSCGQDEDVPHIDGATVAEIRETGTFQIGGTDEGE